MALELIAAIVAAFAMAGLAMLVRKLTGDRLPKWLMPVAAGLGLIGFTIWSEYDWYDRISGELPPGTTVVWQETQSQPLRPWSFLWPLTTAFVALDGREILVHPARQDLRIVKLVKFARWRNTEGVLMAVDCTAKATVVLTETVMIDEAGTLVGAEWNKATEDQGKTMGAACGEG